MKNPKRGEIWKNGTLYYFIFLIVKDMNTDNKRVVFQQLTKDEEMIIHCVGGEILSVKIRQPISMELKTFKEKMIRFKEAPKR